MMDVRAFTLTVVAMCGAFSQVLAQDSGARSADEVVEEIVVTGSRLPRRDFTAPSPIATIDAEALASSGQATLEETLNKMPQMAPDFSRTTNNGSDGTGCAAWTMHDRRIQLDETSGVRCGSLAGDVQPAGFKLGNRKLNDIECGRTR